MKFSTAIKFVGAILVLALLSGATPSIAGEDTAKAEKPKKFYYGASIFTQGRPGVPVMQVKFYITEFSTPQEAANLAKVLKDSGQKGLAKALSKPKEKGTISIANRLGYRIGFIRQFPTPDGGSIIRMATDRPISIPELWGGTRSMDYTIGLAELKLDSAGKCEGVLFYAAKVKFNEQGMLEIEAYGIAPAKLINVRQYK